ncbi:MAG: YceI family protein [Bdellovibrionales bacterium]
MKKLGIISFLSMFAISLSATTVDLEKSELKWKADKELGSGHYGTIKLDSASAEIKDGKIKKGTFVVNMKSIDVSDLSGTWKDKFLGHVKTKDFFLVDKFPTATLTITGQKSGNIAVGEIEIKKVKQPVEIKFDKKGKVYTGKLMIDRTKHGIKYGSKKNFVDLAMDKAIKDQFEIEFKIAVK